MRGLLFSFCFIALVSCNNKKEGGGLSASGIAYWGQHFWISSFEEVMAADTVDFTKLKRLYFNFNAPPSITMQYLMLDMIKDDAPDDAVDSMMRIDTLMKKRNKYLTPFYDCSLGHQTKEELEQLLEIEKELLSEYKKVSRVKDKE